MFNLPHSSKNWTRGFSNVFDSPSFAWQSLYIVLKTFNVCQFFFIFDYNWNCSQDLPQLRSEIVHLLDGIFKTTCTLYILSLETNINNNNPVPKLLLVGISVNITLPTSINNNFYIFKQCFSSEHLCS